MRHLRVAVADAQRRYTRSINFREGWRGHLWQERFHSVVMDEFHPQTAVPWVENNPVRAGLCAVATEWLWSSAAESVATCAHGLVDRDLRAHLLDHGPIAERSQGNDPADEIRRHTRTGRPLGARSFVDQLEAMTGRAFVPRKPGPTPGGRGSGAPGAGWR